MVYRPVTVFSCGTVKHRSQRKVSRPRRSMLADDTMAVCAGQASASSCCGPGKVKDVSPYCRVLLDDSMRMPFATPLSPTRIYDFLYLGDGDTAKNITLLKQMGVTCVINTAALYIATGEGYYSHEGIRYLGIDAEDEMDYDIMQHFPDVWELIERERRAGGVVFLHCIAGVNRSGALAVAYCMVRERWGPIKASRFIRDRRERVLSNDEFQRQLVQFANEKNLLILDKEFIKPPVDPSVASTR